MDCGVHAVVSPNPSSAETAMRYPSVRDEDPVAQHSAVVVKVQIVAVIAAAG